jgi:hypothetical protein
MGFYIRKSVRVGPLRFNLSKSGIGVSTGIPGFRIGTGPRGTYIHVGTGGLYYRKTISIQAKAKHNADLLPRSTEPVDQLETRGQMTEVGSGCVSKMVTSSSSELLAELEQKRTRILWWPKSLILTLLAATGLVYFQLNELGSTFKTLAVTTAFAAITVAVYIFDRLTKSVVLMYELDGRCLEAYQRVFSAVEALASCGAVWQLTGHGDVFDPRYHAGAGKVIRRQPLSIKVREPPYVKTNLSIPSLQFRKHTLYLLPDQILVFASNGVGAIDYHDLKFLISTTRFIEDRKPPDDAKVVDYTWRFVNNNGSPDRRFKNNRKVPICQYELLAIASATGIKEVLQLSRLGTSECFQIAIYSAASAIEDAKSAERVRQQLLNDGAEQNRLSSTNRPSVSLASPQKPSTRADAEELQTALFKILCCLMAADGKVSKNEKIAMRSIMTRVDTKWTSDYFETRLASFVSDVKALGYQTVLRNAVRQLPLFKQKGRDRILLECINSIANADGVVSQRTLEFRNKIYEFMQTNSIDKT